MKRANLLSILLISLIIITSATLVNASVTPTGATTNVLQTGSSPSNYTAGNASAMAGNVTEMNLVGGSTTQSWQGYYGNVSGSIQLADSSSRVLYNWSVAIPSGEIYASTNNTIGWTNIQCFNFTATGNVSNGMTGEQAGNTSLFGMNVSQLEAQFNLPSTDADRVNETFTLTGAGTHDAFFTASLLFNEGECRSTRVFGSTGQGVSNQFEEVLLYEPVSDSVVFTSLIEQGSLNGFDNHRHDFEMLVLEDGHGSDTLSTPYYFFVELN